MLMADLIAQIEKKIGASGVVIELSPEDYVLAITEALDELSRYVPGEANASLAVSPSIKRYVVNHKNLIDVLDVQFLDDKQASGNLSENPFLNFNTNGTTPLLGGVSQQLSEEYLTLSYNESARVVMSSDPLSQSGWEYNEDTGENEYAIYVDVPSDTTYRASYRYLFTYDATDDKQCGLPRLRPPMIPWVRDFATACARDILGQIRDKFKGISSPDGMTETGVDGADQIARAQQEKERLIEDIKNRQRHLPILIA